ncbi:MAG TPA: hypothetical protein VFV38_07755 [Ktedonobacteraceae bacterium]|nr:hypothetical protein [Ktedonobacteraceae bacterium]
MDDIHSILINLLSNVVWIPVGMITAWFVYFVGVRLPHRRLWRLSDPSKLTVCASNSTNTNTGVYSRPSTGIGQVRAMALAINSLNVAYHKQLDVKHILLSTDHIQDRMENDLLILGGPKTNRVAAELFKAIEFEQPAIQIKTVIYWRTKLRDGHWIDDGADTYDGHAVNRKVIQDYGLIVRMQSPFTSRQRTVILFSGSHTYGTVVAAKYFTESKDIRHLLKRKQQNLVVLVSAQIIDGYPTKLRLERYHTW